MGPPWKVQNPASSTATLTVLIVASLFKECSLNQEPEYKLTVPAIVSVQHGLCVHIPCSFTSGGTGTGKAYGYWFQKIDNYRNYFITSYKYHIALGIVVATNDNRLVLYKSVENRFRLTGRLTDGNCSFSILDAKPEDEGEYYFRFETPTFTFSYITSSVKDRMPLKVLVTELTEKPQIRNKSPLLPGKETVFTCSIPGPCFKMNTKVTWTTILLGHKTSLWNQQHSDGSWTYGSDFIFTPSIADHGKWLTCKVWYPNVNKEVKNTIFLNISGGWPQINKTVVYESKHSRSVSDMELFVYSVDSFQIIVFLLKLAVCFLFIICIFLLLVWKRFSREG